MINAQQTSLAVRHAPLANWTALRRTRHGLLWSLTQQDEPDTGKRLGPLYPTNLLSAAEKLSVEAAVLSSVYSCRLDEEGKRKVTRSVDISTKTPRSQLPGCGLAVVLELKNPGSLQ